MNDNLRQLGQQMQSLFRQATALANTEVDHIIQAGVGDSQRIEQQLDQMLGFCCDPDMLIVFKRLCRYYFTIEPQATAEYIQAYREMWDTPDESEALGAGV